MNCDRELGGFDRLQERTQLPLRLPCRGTYLQLAARHNEGLKGFRR